MSRVIKFRAWDSEYKEWVKDFHIDRNGVFMGLVADREYIIPADEDRVILVQFTGRFDANDDEVFEGDLLQCKLWDGDLDGVSVVRFGDGEFYLDWDSDEDNFPEDFAGKFHKFEKIGNIYENPELLQGE